MVRDVFSEITAGVKDDGINFPNVDSDAHPVVRKIRRVHNTPVIAVRMFIDQNTGKYFLISTAHDSIKVYSVISFGDEVELNDPLSYEKNRSGADSFDSHADNRLMILADSFSVMHIIQIHSETKMTVQRLYRGAMEITFSRFIPNSYNVFSISFVHGLTFFDLDGSEIKTQPYDKVELVTAVNFSPNGTFLAIGTEIGVVDIFNGLTLNLICTIEDVHLMRIGVVEFTHDEHQLLIGCDDQLLTLHALLEDGPSLVHTFYGHTAPVHSASIDYSSNSSLFASCAHDRKVFLWNMANGEPFQVFSEGFDDVVTAIRFSSNGEYLISGTASGSIIIHRICESIEVEPEDVVIKSSLESDSEQLQIHEHSAIPDLSESEEEHENHVDQGNTEVKTNGKESVNGVETHTPEDVLMNGTLQDEDQRMSATPEDVSMQQNEGPITPPDEDYPME